MSRSGRRRTLAIAIATFAAVAAPAAAQAATYTVAAGGGTCGGADLTCETLADAAGAVANGDTVSVSPGQYTTATFNNTVTIAGTAPGVVVNGSLDFGAAGGGLLSNMTVAQTGAAVPAISTSGPGLEVRDVFAVSLGDGILITAGVNKIVRSTAISAGGGTSGVDVTSGDGTAKSVRLESSLLSGGLDGLRAAATTLLAGAITIDAHHLTAVGGGGGLGLTGFLAAGTVAATITNSIALDNVVTPALVPGGATLTATGANFTTGDRSAIFADAAGGNFRLKPGSPAIDAGGPLEAGESTTDVDGQSRAGATTDLGADEYVNSPPTAAITVKTKPPRDGQPVEFDGSASKDQPGGAIASYRWDFGDGTSQTTTGPAVTHVYKGVGPVTAKLTVVDGEGASSTPASAALTIVDGGAPTVTVTTPRSKQKIKVITKKTKTVKRNGVKRRVTTSKRTRIRFAGKATDTSGVQSVYITVEKTSNASKTTVAQGHASSSKKCTYLDPKKGLRKISCSKPIVIKAKLTGNGAWAYNVKSSIKLSKGGYRVIAYGLDKTGNAGNSAAAKLRNISFTLK